MKKLGTVTVAKRLDLDRDSVSRLFRQARIPNATKILGRWKITEDDLEEFIRQQEDGGSGRRKT